MSKDGDRSAATESSNKPTHWETSQERSTPFMLRLLIRSALALGRAGVRPIVYATVAYFILTSSKARHSSTEFLRRVLPRKPTLIDSWKHFLAFATCSVDRIFFLAKRHRGFQITFDRPKDVVELTDRRNGCLLVLAHFGSFEVMRAASGERQLPISMLLDRQIGQMLIGLFEKLNPNFAEQIIDASKRGPDLVLALKENIERNRMIGIMGDRTRLGDRSVRVDFLGGEAQFPIGPWVLAAALNVPVILCFGVYRGGARYDVHFELFDNQVRLPRGNREVALAEYAQRYAKRLEHYARSAPYNWFNFYDFWQ